MSEIKLLPCPFCGGEAKIMHTGMCDKGKTGYLHCVGCGEDFFRKRWNYEEQKLIKKWNTRKPMEKIVDELAKLSFVCGITMDPVTAHEFAVKAIEIVKEGGAK